MTRAGNAGEPQLTQQVRSKGPVEKFLFNVSFDESGSVKASGGAPADDSESAYIPEEVVQVPTFSEAEMSAARQEGFESGKQEGVNQESGANKKRVAETLDELTQQFQTLFSEQSSANKEIFDVATDIAVTISRKCFPYLNEIYALTAIQEMVKEVLSEIIEEPRAIIRVHPDMVTSLNQQLSKIAEVANFEGQILVIDDEEIPVGNCRLTWSSGSAERDLSVIWQRVDQIIEQNISSLREDDSLPLSESATQKSAISSEKPIDIALEPADSPTNKYISESVVRSGTEPTLNIQNKQTDITEKEIKSHYNSYLYEKNDLDVTVDSPMPPTQKPGKDEYSLNSKTSETTSHSEPGSGNVEQPLQEAILHPTNEYAKFADVPTINAEEETDILAPPSQPNEQS